MFQTLLIRSSLLLIPLANKYIYVCVCVCARARVCVCMAEAEVARMCVRVRMGLCFSLCPVVESRNAVESPYECI